MGILLAAGGDCDKVLGAVDRTDSTYLHEQGVAEIRRTIAGGEAKPGERIPQAKESRGHPRGEHDTVLRALRLATHGGRRSRARELREHGESQIREVGLQTRAGVGTEEPTHNERNPDPPIGRDRLVVIRGEHEERRDAHDQLPEALAGVLPASPS